MDAFTTGRLQLSSDPCRPRPFEHRRSDGDVPGGETVGLEDDDVLVRLATRNLARDDLLELVHLEPVEHPGLDGLDQIGGFEPRVVARVAAHERRTLEHDVVELAAAAVVGAHGADECARPEPLAAQHRIRRAGDSHDHVAGGRILVTLARFGAVLLAESTQALRRAAIGDDLLEIGKRGADRGNLRFSLPATADDAEAAGVARREMPGGYAARRTRSQLAQLVGLENRDQLGRIATEEENHEARTVTKACVDLCSREAELQVCGCHHRERSAFETDPVARPVLDAPGGHAPETRLDCFDRVGGREQFRYVVLRQIERHIPILENGGRARRGDRA
jgi:hypothetical protein